MNTNPHDFIPLLKDKDHSFIQLIGYIFLILLPVAILSCESNEENNTISPAYFNTPDTLSFQTGGVQIIPVKNEKGIFNIWTKRIGNNVKIKILVLAGGPGLPHDYLEVFESFFPKEGFELIYYDELGCGNSDHPEDPSLFNMNRSVEEVEQVREALHLDKDNFYLYGHSWGGALAMEYAIKYQKNLKALIVSNMCSSGKEFNRYVRTVLFKTLPRKVQDSLINLEAKGDMDNPKYSELVMEHFYERYICRMPVNEWPEPLARAFGKMNKSYYLAMQGHSEFGFTGKLKDWDISMKLPQITVPTLTIGAKYDEMDPSHMRWMSNQVQNGSYLYAEQGSHLSMYDDQQFYMKGIIAFIKGINSGAKNVLLTTAQSE